MHEGAIVSNLLAFISLLSTIRFCFCFFFLPTYSTSINSVIFSSKLAWCFSIAPSLDFLCRADGKDATDGHLQEYDVRKGQNVFYDPSPRYRTRYITPFSFSFCTRWCIYLCILYIIHTPLYIKCLWFFTIRQHFRLCLISFFI